MKILIVSPRKVKTELQEFREIFSESTDIGTEGNNIILTIHCNARDVDKVDELLFNFGYKLVEEIHYENPKVDIFTLRRKNE